MPRRPSIKQWLTAVLLFRIPGRPLRRCVRLVRQHELAITFDALVAHHLAGGRIDSWVDGLIYARERGIAIDPQMGATRDLVGKLGTGISLTEQIKAAEAAGHRDMKDVSLKPLLDDMMGKPAPQLATERERVIAAEIRRRINEKLGAQATSAATPAGNGQNPPRVG